MHTGNFWPCVETLAAHLDGDRTTGEEILERIESELLRQPRPARDELRRRMTLIVAGLSRLEVRMVASDGPLEAAV